MLMRAHLSLSGAGIDALHVHPNLFVKQTRKGWLQVLTPRNPENDGGKEKYFLGGGRESAVFRQTPALPASI